MANFLIELEEDITFLTCKECAIDIYVELLEAGYKFLQSKSSVVKEFSKDSEVYEVTKLVAEASEEDVYFVFAVESVEHLDDRHVVVDGCVMDLIDEVEIIDDEEVEDFCLEDECYDDYSCDECLSVEEIMMNDELSFEEALREAYRCGRQAALYEIAEEIESKIFE